jgi:undecaprenyl diphosphate synthase
MIWQAAYAEMVFQDILWPDFDRRDLWRACEIYASRDRRFGGAIDQTEAKRPAGPTAGEVEAAEAAQLEGSR